MSYVPASPPDDPRYLAEYLQREMRRIAANLRDDTPVVFYRTQHANAGTLSAGVSANWKIAAGNVIRLSASNTITLTGLILAEPMVYRELVLANVGTGVVVLKPAGTESSESYRFVLPEVWNLSADAAAILWYDPVSSRFRGISRT